MLEDSTYADATVVAKSRAFHWVEVDRDRTPELAEYFNVSAYPSLITINGDRRKIHRFSGYSPPTEFIPELEEALRRWRLYLDGEEWDTPLPRPDRIVDGVETSTIPAPSEAVPSGLTVLWGDLWVAQQDTLWRLDRRSGGVISRHAIPPSIRDLCTDGRYLYGAEYGWSAGRPIHVIDPVGGRVVREIVSEANSRNRAYSTAGVAYHRGRLYVLNGSSGQIFRVDPGTGAVEDTLQCGENWLTSLDHDGRHFVASGRESLLRIDPDDGRVLERIPANYRLRCVAWDRGDLYVMEQPEFGYDVDHAQVRIWPREVLIYRVHDPVPGRYDR